MIIIILIIIIIIIITIMIIIITIIILDHPVTRSHGRIGKIPRGGVQTACFGWQIRFPLW